MRQLVKLAESREGAAKTRLAAALDARSGMLEVDAPADDVAAAEAAAVANRLDDAKRREAAARARLSKLQAVFIAAQQVQGSQMPLLKRTANAFSFHCLFPLSISWTALAVRRGEVWFSSI